MRASFPRRGFPRRIPYFKAALILIEKLSTPIELDIVVERRGEGPLRVGKQLAINYGNLHFRLPVRGVFLGLVVGEAAQVVAKPALIPFRKTLQWFRISDSAITLQFTDALKNGVIIAVFPEDDIRAAMEKFDFRISDVQ